MSSFDPFGPSKPTLSGYSSSDDDSDIYKPLIPGRRKAGFSPVRGPALARRAPAALAAPAVAAGAEKPKLQLQVTLLRNVPPVNPKSVPIGTLDLGLDQFVYVVAQHHNGTVSWLRLPVSRQAAGLAALKGLLPGAAAPAASTSRKKQILKHPFSMLPEIVAA
jgi:hypothetical protein